MTAQYKDIINDQKAANNRRIAKWSTKYLDRGPHYVLVLDGPETRTSKKLISRGVSTPSRIFAPQFNKRDAISMENRNTCRVLRMTLSDAVNNVNNQGIPPTIMSKMTVFNFDYMGSVFGRRGSTSVSEIYPLSDILKSLSLTRKRDIIVSITVSDRLGSKITKEKKYFEGREGNFGQQLDQDFFMPVFTYTQYGLIKGQYYWYRREQPKTKLTAPTSTMTTRSGRRAKVVQIETPKASKGAIMWFFIYHLRKNPRLRSSEVEFALSPFEGEEKWMWGFNPAHDDSWVG